MRIEPISHFDGGPDWNASVGKVKSVNTAKRIEAERRCEKEKAKKNKEKYRKAMTELAADLNDEQVCEYDSEGSAVSYDASGAMFHEEI